MNNISACGGCGQQPVLVSYPYQRSSLYRCDCCNQMHQPATAQYPASGLMDQNAYMIINGMPYLLDNSLTKYGTKISVSENIYTRVSKRHDPSCINLSAVFDMTDDRIVANDAWNAFLEDTVSNAYDILEGVLPIQKAFVTFRIHFHIEDENKGVVYTNHVDSTVKEHLFHYTDIRDYFVTSFKNVAVTNIPQLDFSGLYTFCIDTVEARVNVVDTKEHYSSEANPFYQWKDNNTKVVLQHDTIEAASNDDTVVIASFDVNNSTPVQLNVTTRLKICFTAYMSNTIMVTNSFGIYKALFNTSGHAIEDLTRRVSALESTVDTLNSTIEKLNNTIGTMGDAITALTTTVETMGASIESLDKRVTELEDLQKGSIIVADYNDSAARPERFNTFAEVKTYLQGHTDSVYDVTVTEYCDETRIESSAFSNCTSLRSFAMSDKITYIGQGAFSNCTNLVDVTMSDNVTLIDSGAFSNTGITSIRIPANCGSIANVAFTNCKSLTDVNIEEGLTGISTNAFSGCSALTTITIPSTVTSIISAFTGCNALISIIVNKSEGSISGAPWGATNATVTWNG